ncbi:MAG: hypothetical protein ACE5GC_01845 [Acidimicrobiia bacterium]
MERELAVGDLVTLRGGEGPGAAGVVGQPITERSAGTVLTCRDGHVTGVAARLEDVDAADEDGEGFAQLAYALVKLGSHIIERRLLVYRD